MTFVAATAVTGPAVLLGLFMPFLALLVLYWVIRLAVRHGIQDSNRTER